jgi:hypothetical protein
VLEGSIIGPVDLVQEVPVCAVEQVPDEVVLARIEVDDCHGSPLPFSL